jgi:hypothetical protein
MNRKRIRRRLRPLGSLKAAPRDRKGRLVRSQRGPPASEQVTRYDPAMPKEPSVKPIGDPDGEDPHGPGPYGDSPYVHYPQGGMPDPGLPGDISMEEAELEALERRTRPAPVESYEPAPTPPRPRYQPVATEHYTIDTYIQQHGIPKTVIHKGDPGAPTIDSPVPAGWQSLAPADLADWAYSSIVFSVTSPLAGGRGEFAAVDTVLYKLTGNFGNVDQFKILQYSRGEAHSLPGFILGDACVLVPNDYGAFFISGTWVNNGETELVAQLTTVIPADDGMYVLQLNGRVPAIHERVMAVPFDTILHQTTITL